MPLNVVDNYGKHLGVIVAKFMHKFVVAVTEATIGDYLNPFHSEITTKAAEAWQCKNIFGKINEEKFLATLKQWIPVVKEEHFHVGKSLNLYALNKEDLNRYGLVKAFPTSTYILAEGKLLDDYYNIKLGIGTGRIPGLGSAKTFPALVGEITGIPQVFCYTQSTKVKFNTGDTDLDLTLPGIITTQKGQEISLDVDFLGQKIIKALTNGIVFYF